MKRKAIIWAIAIILTIQIAGAVDWWDLQYPYRQPISITNNDPTYNMLGNYSITVTVNTTTLISEGKMNANCSDLRIICGGTEREYTFQNETLSLRKQFGTGGGCASTTTNITFQARIGNITASTTNETGCYVYYGKATATKPTSGYNTTFRYYFGGTKGAEWTYDAGLTWNGTAVCGVAGDSNAQANFSNTAQYIPFIEIVWEQKVSDTGSQYGGIAITGNEFNGKSITNTAYQLNPSGEGTAFEIYKRAGGASLINQNTTLTFQDKFKKFKWLHHDNGTNKVFMEGVNTVWNTNGLENTYRYFNKISLPIRGTTNCLNYIIIKDWLPTEPTIKTLTEETMLLQYFTITAVDEFDNSAINNFTAYVQNETGVYVFPTTNGTTEVLKGTYNITISSPTYFNKTETNYNATNDGNLEFQIYQSTITLWSNEITTNNRINNWTINTGISTHSTTTGNVTFHVKLGTYSWNWTNTEGYFNTTGIEITVDETAENQTMTGFYARNLTFISQITGKAISPTCTLSGTTYTTTPMIMPKGEGNVECSLTGFQNLTIGSLQPTPDNSQYNMTPAMLWLTFSEQTNGFIETENCTANQENCKTFNSTTIYIQQSNVSTGYVVVKFNPDGTNWQQIFKYYNDNNTYIREMIKIITPDLEQQIKVRGNGKLLDSARVTIKNIGNNTDTGTPDWITVYSEYTDPYGIAKVLIDDQDTYKICAQKEGYTPTCTIEFIPPSNTGIITIDLTPSEEQGGNNYIETTCPNIFTETTTCNLTIVTYKTYSSICANLTTGTTSTQSCSTDSVTKTYIYTIQEGSNYTIAIKLDGTTAETITHRYLNHTESEQISWGEKQDQEGFTLMDRIRSDKTYLILVYIIFTIIGIAMGILAEHYFKNYGTYGTMVFYTVIATGGLYIFWIPVIIIAVYIIIDKLVPLYTNK